MGTQVAWQPDWGWGELNLSAAYDQRLNFASDAVPALGVRFYRANVSAGDRATLVWNRRVVGPLDQVVAPTAMTLSNLDLYQYDIGGGQQAASESAIDNVEQVRGTSTGQVVYKVKDQSSRVDGAAAEPFALAAANPLTPLAAPVPKLTLTADRSAVRRGEPVTLTATLTNASTDLPASNASVALQLPAGMHLASGDATWIPDALPAGATLTKTWTLEGDEDSAAPLTASASATAFGETFSSRASTPLTVDSSPPAVSLTCTHSDAADPQIAVAWSSVDSSPIEPYALSASTDGGPFVPWLTNVTGSSAIFTGVPGHSYAVAVTAADALGNSAPPTLCGPVTIGFAPLAPAVPTGQGGSPLPAPPHLRVTRVSFGRSRLTVSGVVARDASGRVLGSYSPRGGRRVRAHTRAAHGRYALVFKLSRKQSRIRRGALRISYLGDPGHAPQHLSRAIVRRR
jgi:uncharacterized repeat protein (TIGR01451 family)